MRTRIKIWLLKKLIGSLVEDAIQSNDHLLADKIIILEDAFKEVGFFE
ncbi:hypothetical protein [Pelosinus sp. IPA-1]|nr:hypothetical protein [Pelosinus sp. IPA-1]GMB01863.1 hypothetical protein PIPA1_46630 [Pelosinus sp. IPA-1]